MRNAYGGHLLQQLKGTRATDPGDRVLGRQVLKSMLCRVCVIAGQAAGSPSVSMCVQLLAVCTAQQYGQMNVQAVEVVGSTWLSPVRTQRLENHL